jgi:hypothetical protein
MPSSREPKNIPVSISILHEQEYNNLCLMVKDSKKKRRAFSERSGDRSDDSSDEIIQFKLNTPRRKTLKN